MQPNISYEKYAQQALNSFDLAKFLTLLPNVKYDVDKRPLALQAADVAFQKKDCDALQKLASMYVIPTISERDFYSYDISYQELLKHLFHYLVKLNAYDTAVGIIIFHLPQVFDIKKAWPLLAQAFLAENIFDRLVKILPYLNQTDQNNIIENCLNKISIQQQLDNWLYWFDQYAKLNNKLSKQLETTLLPAILTLDKLTTFLRAFHALANSSCKQQIIYKLFVAILKSSDRTRSIQLLDFIPVELVWLKDLPKVLMGTANIALLAKLEPEDSAYFVKEATNAFVVKNQSLSDADFYSAMVQAVTSVATQKTTILEIALEMLIQNKRTALCLQLLTQLDNYKRPAFILKLLTNSLTVEQYQTVLELLDDLDSDKFYSDEDKIVAKIPANLVQQERDKRGQRIHTQIRQEFDIIPTISQKHAQLAKYVELLNGLKRHKQYELLFIACQKLTPSAIRDEFLADLFQYAFCGDNLKQADHILSLFSNKKIQNTLKSVISFCQKNKFKEALQLLVSFETENPFDDVILKCTQKIIECEPTIFNIKFFVDIKLFDTNFISFAIENTRTYVTNWAVDICQASKSLTTFIQSQQTPDFDNFHLYLLKELLSKKLFTDAVLLLNQKSKPQLSAPFKKIIEEHCERYQSKNNFDLTFYQSLGKLLDQTVKMQLLQQMVRVQCQQPTPTLTNIQLVAAVPVATLRTDGLIKLVCNALCNDQPNMARQAQLKLPSPQKELWLKIIELDTQQLHSELIRLLMKEKIYNDNLVKRICTSPSWSQGCTAKELYQLVQDFQAAYAQIIATINAPDNYALLLETILNETFNQWQAKLLKEKRHQILSSNLVGLLHKALPSQAKTLALNILKDNVEKLVNEDCTALAADCVITLINAHNFLVVPIALIDKIAEGLLSIHFRDDKSPSMKKLLELLAIIKPFDQSVVTKCIFKICEYCIDNHAATQIPAILQQATFISTYDIELKAKGWVLKLIQNNGKFEDINFLVTTYLSNATETIFSDIIEAMLTKNMLTTARQYQIKYISSPGTKLRLQQALATTYKKQLDNMIGVELAEKLMLLSQQMAPLLRALKDPQKQQQANLSKNQLIVELRSTLDKAFLTFYTQKYGEPPLLPDHSGNHVNVYFPVVPASKLAKLHTIEACLKDYFQKIGIKNFVTQHSLTYSYIKSIQPTINNQYAWLAQLYQMANQQKHAADLKPTHKIEEVEIDIETFLPKVLDGITEILLHLFRKSFVSQAQITAMKFSDYIKMDATVLPTQTMHALLVASAPQAPTLNNNNNNNHVPKTNYSM